MPKNKVKISILLGVMCFLLTIGICIQIKTVNESSTKVGRTQTENELRDNILKWKEKYDNAYSKLEKSEKELEELREKASNNDENSTNLSKSLEEYNNLLGYSELTGKGIIIKLNDGDSSTTKGIATNYIVHDGDILEVVNALKNAGAEAISINGQRIVSNTPITCAGNIIKINGEKIGAPYEISAIGLTSKLYGAVTIPGGYLEILTSAGVKVEVEQIEKNNIVIPKYEGVYKFEYANNVE